MNEVSNTFILFLRSSYLDVVDFQAVVAEICQRRSSWGTAPFSSDTGMDAQVRRSVIRFSHGEDSVLSTTFHLLFAYLQLLSINLRFLPTPLWCVIFTTSR